MLTLFTVLNRQRAAGIFLKSGVNEQGKAGTELKTARGLYGTHTTLPSCFPAVSAYPQKTAIYAPIQSHRCDRKARICHGFAYGEAIESQYFNGLISRCPLPLSALQER
jgi:hypothetical protein